MNILILSGGRRTQLIKYFKKEFEGVGRIVVTDCDKLAPALYVADKSYIVPKIYDDNYINIIKEICEKEHIKAIFSLIDPELSLIAQHKHIFKAMDIECIVSDYEITELCFDKYEMYKFLKENQFNCARSYIDLQEFIKDYKQGKIHFPVFVKPITGSASVNINKIHTLEELIFIVEKSKGLMIQEYLEGTEYGVDVYTDLVSNNTISIFVKEKIRMRAGETDKSKSIIDTDLNYIIEKFVSLLGTVGPIDIDVFRVNNQYYISEVNPRFGGGYIHAYECGVNFPMYIKVNLMGMSNKNQIGLYEEKVYMMKHDTVEIKRENQLIL